MPRCSLLFCLLLACAVAPPPPEPVRHLTVRYAQQPWLAALAGGPATPAVEPARQLLVRAFWLMETPEAESVDGATAWIVASRGAPFRGTAHLSRGLLLLQPAPARAWLAAVAGAAPDAVQPIGETAAVVAATLGTRIGMDALPVPDVIGALVGGEVRLALVAPHDDTAEGELVLLRPGLAAGDALALIAPSAAGGGCHAVVFTAGAELPDTAAAAALSQAAPDRAAAHQAPFAVPVAQQVAMAQQAIGAHHRLGALLALTLRLDLPRCTDLLLAADEAALIALGEGLPTGELAGAWPVERAMWSAVLPTLQRGEATPALRACLRRQLGAATMDAAALQLLLDTSASTADFLAGVRDANLAALGDRDSSARWLGHTWLLAHGGAIPGYDPLQERAARDAALQHAAAAHRAPEAGR